MTQPSEPPEDAPPLELGLCLSGGGFRAMLFHLGAIWRLHQCGLLSRIQRISSVSGGSITAAALGMVWDVLKLSVGPATEKDFVNRLINPVRELARHTIDVGSILDPFRSTATNIAAAYRKHLFFDATLQSLPDQPVFVINATNIQSGALWRFTKEYMGDYRVGRWLKPETTLAIAVGASSAFPPFLSPVPLPLNSATVHADPGSDLCNPDFTHKVWLTDGGVYDNLGMETVFKRCKSVLVSDGGAKTMAESDPATDWARHSMRVLDLVDNQVRSLRKRTLIQAYQSGERGGTYWGIRTNVADYAIADSLPCPANRTMELAAIPTRLAAIDEAQQQRLINWGYAVCDSALRAHVDSTMARGNFPCPGGV